MILLRSWSNQTVDGDISTCVSVAEDSQAWPLVTSTNDNCLGSDCPMYKDCFVVKARKKAMDADVVVVNHHLFLADMVVKESGFGELIPEADVMIFDEPTSYRTLPASILVSHSPVDNCSTWQKTSPSPTAPN
ncbi:putative ATP-binding protein [Escherichia coli]|nr:putative ATP-binding protein [Escherichia coli]